VSDQVLDLCRRLVALVSHRDRTELDTALRESSWLGSLLQEAERLTHVGRELTAPSYAHFLQTVHPQDRALVDATFQASFRTGRPYRIEHRLLLVDGLLKVVLERGRTTLGDGGAPLITVGTVQDISEQDEIQQRLERIAFVDPLTRLPNKTAAVRQLARLLRSAGSERGIALINLDLDTFQAIINGLGRAINISPLQLGAERLRPGAGEPRAGDHRNGVAERSRTGRRAVAAAHRKRPQPGHRRFRHGLLLPAHRQTQDRPLLRGASGP
jgi:hypothetical protein